MMISNHLSYTPWLLVFSFVLLLSPSVIADGTAEGCFSSLPSGFVKAAANTYQSSKTCQVDCASQGYNYFALKNGADCYCGDSNADSGDKVSSTNCNVGCLGYNQEMCGGQNAYNFYEVDIAVSSKGSASSTTLSSSTSSLSTSSTTSTTDLPGATSGSDSTPRPNSSASSTTNSSSSSSSNSPSASASGDKKNDSGVSKGAIVGIVVGVVLGLLAIVSLVLLAFWYRKRNHDDNSLQGGNRNPFVDGDDKFGGSDLYTPYMNNDDRLNPKMLGTRRLSQGTLADEADYSRKILRVANPDDY